MPPNKSLNKVRVTSLFGTESNNGLTDPAVGMPVRNGSTPGWIVALDSGNFQVSLALASGGIPVTKAYPHELRVTTGAANFFGWPSGQGDVVFGHLAIFANGTPVTAPNKMTYMSGSGPASRLT